VMAKKVLIVDDSQAVRQSVIDVLVPAGFEVVEAEDGLDGEEKISSLADLDLVICDMNMPRMGGLEMLTRVKADAKNERLLVLMMTTEGRPELVQQAKRLGARGWLVKPVKSDMLLVAVRKVLGV